MGTQKTASDKIGWMEEYISKSLEKYDSIMMDSLIAHFCYIHKSTPRTAKSILKMLQDMGKIRIKGNEISR